ncbi:hypothetical protein ACWERI_38125, partial [Streptomyces collinus]
TPGPEPEAQPEPDSTPGPEPEAQPEPDSTPGPAALSVRERLRRAGWAQTITVVGAGLAAVAAVGGLWAQAVATYWTQQTARDQLSQSVEDSQREERAQASQVSFWVAYPPSGGSPELHILNRSLDPVTNVYLGAMRINRGMYYGRRRGGKGMNYSPGVGGDLPPCTEEVYKVQNMWLGPLGGETLGPEDTRESFIQTRASFQTLTFVDSHGRAWERSKGDLSERVTLGMGGHIAGMIDLGKSRVMKADVCGDVRK